MDFAKLSIHFVRNMMKLMGIVFHAMLDSKYKEPFVLKIHKYLMMLIVQIGLMEPAPNALLVLISEQMANVN